MSQELQYVGAPHLFRHCNLTRFCKLHTVIIKSRHMRSRGTPFTVAIVLPLEYHFATNVLIAATPTNSQYAVNIHAVNLHCSFETCSALLHLSPQQHNRAASFVAILVAIAQSCLPWTCRCADNVQSLGRQHIINVEVSTQSVSMHVAPCTLPSLDTAPAPCIGALPVVVDHL